MFINEAKKAVYKKKKKKGKKPQIGTGVAKVIVARLSENVGDIIGV